MTPHIGGNTLEAQEAVLKYREEILKVTEENLELKKELADLKKQLAIEHELVYIGEVYYRIKNGDQKEGPYCQRCFDVDGKLVRLTTYTSSGIQKYACNQCHNGYRA